jgi:hypothetical protein
VRRRSLGEGPVNAPEGMTQIGYRSRTPKELNRKAEATMIWVARAVAALAVMLLIYALILKFVA